MNTQSVVFRAAARRLATAANQTGSVEVTVRRQDIELLLMAFVKRALPIPMPDFHPRQV